MADNSAQDGAEKGRYLWIHPTTNAEPLPSPLLKHARETQQPLLRKLEAKFSWCRALAVLVLLSIYLCYYFAPSIGHYRSLEAPFLESDKHFDLVNGAQLPLNPTAIVFEDRQGKSRWTVSIPSGHTFPLRPHQYEDICRVGERVSKSVDYMNRRSRIMGKPSIHQKHQYNAVDKAFMDVYEAEGKNLLPPTSEKRVLVVGESQDSNTTRHLPVCEKSLTFVMETVEAGFGHSLITLWLSYGLAKKEGRAFFIDDSNWPYGNYTTYFPAPPQPACSPPPPEHILPCPHSARHLVVSAATIPWTFGAAFKAEYHSAHSFGAQRSRKIYDMVRSGHDDLFSLVGEDAAFLKHKLSVLRTASSATDTPLIGMHVRRGDRHPYEYEYSNDYLPLERYTSTASSLFSSFPSNHTLSSEDHVALLLASDDPDILTSPDLTNTLPNTLSVVRAQERIVLASKRTLTPAVPLREPGSAYTKHVDENSGWEGGFFTALFFALGKGHPSSSGPEELDPEMMEQALHLRELVGRAYLLDLAVLSQADAVVCASSSAACRVMGVMMGWEKITSGHWSNVDAKREWTWDGLI
ncbi:hypothetical protein MBLNU459_g5788t1 [Dothideomycetes sp. NU459]